MGQRPISNPLRKAGCEVFRVITVTSGKGGTGKSTVCTFLGQALAAQGLRTLLIEPGSGLRSLDAMLALEQNIVYDLEDLLEGRCTPQQAVISHEQHSGLQMIAAAGGFEYQPDEYAFEQLIKWVRQYYDVIILDTPPGFGRAVEICAQNSDLGIVVTTPDLVAVRDSGRASILMHKNGLHDQRLIINKVPKTLVARQGITDLDDVIDAAGVQLIGVLPYSETIKIAAGAGRSIPDYDISKKIFDAIAARMMGKREELLIF